LFHQAEIDLRYLKRRLSVQTLGNAYKKQLLDETQFIQTVYEIYTAALLASVSKEIDLHAPGKGDRDCDFRITIHGCEIYGDVKTRYDQIPFKTPPKKDASGEELYSASRATVDYRVAERTPPDELDRSTPESGELREIILEDTLPKFPEGKPNLIVLGLIDAFGFPSKTRENLTAAVYGDAFHLFRGGKHIPSRYPNGVFDDPTYGKEITSIAWVSLGRSRQGLIRRSGIFFNPNATITFPEEVKAVLERVFDRENLLQRELVEIVEKLKREYQPKEIILFGSLAQGDVKEGSDIDLAIIKETNKRPLDRCLEVAALTQPSVAVNFLVYTPEEFEKETEAGNFFVADEIVKKGHILYER
jgi:predicted nucleotidyltransferase